MAGSHGARYTNRVTTKADYLATIISEFMVAQRQGAQPAPKRRTGLSFPPLLPVGDGKHLFATEALLTAITKYANLLRQNSAATRSAFKEIEFNGLVRLAFGRALNELFSNADKTSVESLGRLVDQYVQADTNARRQDVDLVVGCWLIEDQTSYPITIGPVTFGLRRSWLERQFSSGRLSSITFRRLNRRWSGDKLRKRKLSWDEHKETAILEAVGPCPIVCSVSTHGLSSNLVEEKGLLAARLAMTALSLLWERPQRPLEQMNLIYDGNMHHRRYAIMYGERGVGSSSSISLIPQSYRASEPLRPYIENLEPTLNILGASISAYVDPHSAAARPRVSKALFLSLWWYHEGCKEPSDQMAVTAFAASLDALACGGHAGGIKKVLEARLGYKSSGALMKDGRSTSAVIDAIYNAARSKFVHGSSVDYIEDWTKLRGTAEAVGRLALVHTTKWLFDHPDIDDMKALQQS